MDQYTAELGEINQLCSTQLFRNFAKIGIDPWWKNSNATKGCAVFARYDPWHTCGRVLPDSPRYFQAALRSNIISQEEADDLGRELLHLISELLPRYKGHFQAELQNGRIGQILRQAATTPDLSLHEAHQNLFPDEIYKAIPWPTLLQHFTRSQFAPASLSRQAIGEASKHPLRAITVGADVVNLLAGLKMTPQTILRILRCLRAGDFGGCFVENQDDILKVVVPSFVEGFQGATFGVFTGLKPEQQTFVLGELQQFTATIGGRAALAREQECLGLLENATALSSYANGIIGLLPPVTLLAVVSGNEQVIYKLRRDAEFLSGYELLRTNDVVALEQESADLLIEADWMGRTVRILVRPVSDLEGFDPTYTIIRVKARIKGMLARLKTVADLQPLPRSHLQTVRASLLGQIAERRGALAACKRLYLVDFAYRNHNRGEMVMSNSKCKEFLIQFLGETSNGYHIAGKAAARYEAEIAKMMPSAFTFEKQTSHTLLARWRPADKVGD